MGLNRCILQILSRIRTSPVRVNRQKFELNECVVCVNAHHSSLVLRLGSAGQEVSR